MRPWGHITCDGSVANAEAMWAARNLKYYPLAIAHALRTEPALAAARDLEVPLPTGGAGRLVDLDGWQLLNLDVDAALALAPRIESEYGVEVVYHGGVDPTVGVYGIEGSKPGAAAAGVYLSHRVIRTDETGYGKILGKCIGTASACTPRS